MGNREDLLAGAAQCLRERGWARTTVRDIAAAAGVSHAAIGYHFGSREALLSQAYVRAMAEWGEEIDRVQAAGPPGGDSADRAAGSWSMMIRSFQAQPQLWRASVDAMLQAEHAPELRKHLADGQQEGREGAAAGLLGIPEPDVDPDAARSLGSVQMALISGIMVQWLLDPERAPSGADVVAGIRRMAELLGPAAE
jgi:AcrR family transcriptional regulator